MKILYYNPVKYDYLSLCLIEGFSLLHREGVIECCFLNRVEDPRGVADVDDMIVCDQSYIESVVDDFDMIIFDSGDDNWAVKNRGDFIKDDEVRKKSCFVDIIDGMSYEGMPNDFAVYFKRELRPPFWPFIGGNNIRSINYGILDRMMPDADTNYVDEWKRRDLDFSMTMACTNAIRVAYGQGLQSFMDQSDFNGLIRVEVDRPYSFEDYVGIIGRSKVSLSLPGLGMDTLRYWEIPALGAVLMSADLHDQLIIRNNFEHMRHALQVENVSHAIYTLNEVCTNMDLWCRMRRASDAWCYRHRSRQRAADMILMFKEMNG